MSIVSGSSLIFIMNIFRIAIKDGIPDVSILFLKVAIALIAYFVFGVYSDKIMFKISHETVMEMRIDLCLKIFKSSYENIENKKQQLITCVVSDINSLARIIDKIPTTIQSFVVGASGIGYLFLISWKLSLLLLATLGIIFLIIKLRNPKVYSLTQKSRLTWDKVYHDIHDIIFGIKELTLNSDKKEVYINQYLTSSSKNEVTDKVKLRFYNQIGSKLSEAVLLLGVCLMIGSTFLFSEISATTITEFLTISLFVITPITTFSSFIKEMIPLKAITDHILKIGIDLTVKEVKSDNKLIKKPLNVLKLDRIEYQYKNSNDYNFQLGPLTFNIPAEEITIVYGSNGSGKTTLGKILAGLYLPSAGTLIWNEENIDHQSLESYRSKISAVFADNHLFQNYKISDNQKFQFEMYLDIFQIKNKIQYENNEIKSKGLSTGQGKRLALVLSLLEDKEIYIFDEWAANQDPLFKFSFYNKLLPELKKQGKTVILITHDDQYFNVADYKIHLQEGKLI